jgi:tyrosine-protein phosphatase YwqE
MKTLRKKPMTKHRSITLLLELLQSRLYKPVIIASEKKDGNQLEQVYIWIDPFDLEDLIKVNIATQITTCFHASKGMDSEGRVYVAIY